MTKQQFLKQFLMKHKIYDCRSISNKALQDRNYDSQSYLIGIDNHASASMTNRETEFIDTPKQANIPIKGIKWHLTTSKIVTVR
jgi:hypothetical protein